jgi:SM-20-related protein
MSHVEMEPVVANNDLGEPFISIVDDVLPQDRRRELNVFLHRPGWKFGWKSDPQNDHFSFWHKHFAGNKNPDNYEKDGAELQYECAKVLGEKFPILHSFWVDLNRTFLQGHSLVRCYANGTPFGSEGSIHTDSVSSNSYTAVYYPHEKWHPNWGGETILFNHDKSDILTAVYPKPNRLLLFRGTIPHVARGVSRSCPALRITLMFKTEFPA